MNPSLSFSNFGSPFFDADEERGSHCINVVDRINAVSFFFAFGEAAASEAKTSKNLFPGSGPLAGLALFP